jgi:hypothetical protein
LKNSLKTYKKWQTSHWANLEINKIATMPLLIFNSKAKEKLDIG